MNIVIFSKNRAMQLDLLLRSLFRNYCSAYKHNISVVYLCDDEYISSYNILENTYLNVKFINQNELGFKDSVIKCIDINDRFTTFLVDDIVITRKFTMINELDYFYNNVDIATLSLRLDRRLTYSYVVDKNMTTPNIDTDNTYVYKYSELDWNYPMSVDGNVFRTSQILPRIVGLWYSNPNNFEIALTNYPIEGSRMMILDNCVLVNNPNNRVQVDQIQNRSGGGNPKTLNNMFNNGYRIEYSQYDMYNNSSVHEIMEYEFYKPRNIKINDVEFGGIYSRGCGNLKYSSEYVNWTNTSSEDVEIFTDRMLVNVDKSTSKYKIAWLIEPIAFQPQNYAYVVNNKNKFDYILTHEESIVDNQQIFYIPHGACWIKKENTSIYNKNKLISMVCSYKNYTKLHNFRNLVADTVKNDVSLMTSVNGQYQDKFLSLREYMFQIVVENDDSPLFFTEKILDCFATGTIPIYCGTPKISRFFNASGIICFSSIDELLKLNITPELYYSMMSSIQTNYSLFEKYRFSEDYIYKFLETVGV